MEQFYFVDYYYNKISSKYNSTVLRRDLVLYEKYVYDYFYKKIVLKTQEGIFNKRKSWNLLYYFLGELYIYSNSKESHRTGTCVFHKDTNDIEVNINGLFGLFLHLSDHLGDIKGLGLPKWLKKDSNIENRYLLFKKELNSILKKPELVKNIMKGRERTKVIVLNQGDALRLAGKMKVEDVISYCRKVNGNKRYKTFNDLASFKRNGKKLHARVKHMFEVEMFKNGNYNLDEAKKKIKEYRLTEKSCLRYLKYLALLGTVSTRVGKSLEVNAKREAVYFKYGYLFLRRACEENGWMSCVDQTYFPKIRSRTFRLNVLRSVKKDNNIIELNNLEVAYKDLLKDGLGYYEHKYIKERVECAAGFKRINDLRKEKSRIFFSIKNGYIDKEFFVKKLGNIGKEMCYIEDSIKVFNKTYKDPKGMIEYLKELRWIS